MSAVIPLPDPAPRTARDPRVAEREHHKLAKRLRRQVGQAIADYGMIEAGDKVIVSGVQKVKEGAPARAVAWQPQATPGNEGASAPQAGDAPAAQQEQPAEDAAAQPQQ